MKYIDDKYRIYDKNNIDFNVEKHWTNMLLFLKSIGVKEEILTQINKDYQDSIIEIINGEKYKVKYNGDIYEYDFPRSVRAASNYIEQERVENGFRLKPGIVLRDKNIEKFKHVFTHESIHMFAIKTELPYDNRGINYSKCGAGIVYYNQDDQPINKDLDAKGLNEGITELLTQKYMNDKDINIYELQTIIARIMTRHNRSLINAYFSRNDQDMKEFYKDFDERQSFITSKDLISMPENIITDKEQVCSLLEGAISYNLSFVPQEKIEKEAEKLKDILSSLDRSLDYGTDSFSYTELPDRVLKSSRVR